MNKVEIVFWDVQHGNACYIKSPNGRHIVIDLGTGDYSGRNISFSPLMHLWKNYHINQLDYVVVTHPHRDHIDDILNLRHFNPNIFVRPIQLSNSEVMTGVQINDVPKFEEYCRLNRIYNKSINEAGMSFDIKKYFGGMSVIHFCPSSCPHNNFNNHSILTVIEYATVKIVIPGDNEACSLNELMGSLTFLRTVMNADILLAPHHGRQSGFHVDFVKFVNPRLCIVSDGNICDTSANHRYSQISRGYPVFKKSTRQLINRKCLTTNSDGEVFISFGLNNQLTVSIS